MLPIFVINLDNSKHRLERISAELSKYHLDFERVSAVDGRTADSDTLNKHYCASLNEKTYYNRLTVGEIACYLSHRKVWQQIVERELPHAVVLEDDVMMLKDITDLNALTDSAKHFDYIKLSDHPSRPRKTKAVDSIGHSSLVTFNKIPAGTCAQLVSLEGAKKLLKHSEQFGRPVDIDIQHWWEKDLIIYGMQPFNFVPAPDIPSDISAVKNRGEMKKRRFKRIKQQLLFKLNNAIHSYKKHT